MPIDSKGGVSKRNPWAIPVIAWVAICFIALPQSPTWRDRAGEALVFAYLIFLVDQWARESTAAKDHPHAD